MLSIKLDIKKPRFWQTKWKIKKPHLCIIELDKKGVWLNTYWWEGNWRESDFIEFLNSAEAKIYVNIDRGMRNTKIMIIGSKGTDLKIKEGKDTKDFTFKGLLGNDTSDWICFGEITFTNIGVPTFHKKHSYIKIVGINLEKSN